MNKRKRNGFVLVLVITAMAVIGIHMFALAGVANTMQFQSHTAYLRACERNLLASGMAWATQNARNESGENLDKKTIELDTSRMSIRDSALAVTTSTQADGTAQVHVASSCTRGRQTFSGTNDWTQP